MKATILREYGENTNFELSEVPSPVLKANEVLIEVGTSSVNTVDTMIKNMGSALPFAPQNPSILGMDLAGTVKEIGAEVNGFTVGDEVYGCVGGLGDLQGTLAEFVAADARLIAKKPKNLSMKEAAALPLVGITAYEGLKRAGVSEGQNVLVHGGTGGVGHVAVQLAKHYGAEVYSTVSGDVQAEIVKGYGARPINYKTESVADYVQKHTDGIGFDVVFDSVGGANMSKSFEAAALNGHVASTVSLCEIDLSTVHFKGLSLHVVFMLIPMLHNFKREQHGAILKDIAKIVEAGGLKPLLDESQHTLDSVGDAYARLQSRKAMGKVVIEN